MHTVARGFLSIFTILLIMGIFAGLLTGCSDDPIDEFCVVKKPLEKFDTKVPVVEVWTVGMVKSSFEDGAVKFLFTLEEGKKVPAWLYCYGSGIKTCFYLTERDGVYAQSSNLGDGMPIKLGDKPGRGQEKQCYLMPPE